MDTAKTKPAEVDAQAGQAQLNGLRRAHGITRQSSLRATAEIAQRIEQAARTGGGDWGPAEPESPVGPQRTFTLTPLSEMTSDHLEPEQAARLQKAIKQAQQFIDTAGNKPGTSMVFSGNYGTGKTTIALNVLRAAFSADYGYIETDGTYVPSGTALLGKKFNASDMPAIMRQNPLSSIIPTDRLRQGSFPIRCIVIDDLGEEDLISASGYMPTDEKANEMCAHMYGRLIDYCYMNKVSVVITTNMPLMVNGQINPAFIERIGRRAFDRLIQMARGYFVTLDIPTYRNVLAQQLADELLKELS